MHVHVSHDMKNYSALIILMNFHVLGSLQPFHTQQEFFNNIFVQLNNENILIMHKHACVGPIIMKLTLKNFSVLKAIKIYSSSKYFDLVNEICLFLKIMKNFLNKIKFRCF